MDFFENLEDLINDQLTEIKIIDSRNNKELAILTHTGSKCQEGITIKGICDPANKDVAKWKIADCQVLGIDISGRGEIEGSTHPTDLWSLISAPEDSTDFFKTLKDLINEHFIKIKIIDSHNNEELAILTHDGVICQEWITIEGTLDQTNKDISKWKVEGCQGFKVLGVKITGIDEKKLNNLHHKKEN